MNIAVDLEIDADEVVRDAHSTVYEIAEEAIAEGDIAEKVAEEVDQAVDNVLEEKMEEYLEANPEAVLKALFKALGLAQNHGIRVASLESEVLRLNDELNRANRQVRDLQKEIILTEVTTDEEA